MNSKELAKYYVNQRDEFFGEDGHEKLLKVLKKHMKSLETDKQIVGIDVGTCTGEYIEHVKQICNESDVKILCFEPNPLNLQALLPKVESAKNIQVFPFCLSNETKKTELFNLRNFPMNFHGNVNAGLRSGGSKICDIEVQRLEDVLDSHFDGKEIVIKFIKIDTEGNDTNILKGMQKYLKFTKYIIFECSDCLDDHRGPGIPNPMKDAVDFLSKNGFDTYRIGTKKLFKVNDQYWNPVYENVKFWSNCFAIQKDDHFIHTLIDDNFNYKE
jgi:FkbM family methyltransferase